MVRYGSKNSGYKIISYLDDSHSGSLYSPKSYTAQKPKIKIGCTCFGTGCKGTCRMYI